ncbi:hypothetical protein [Comamonas thiooxydans]|uniref:hypothetical protein n=1 Tax=Comamonas thiooxydans TaxID=363952 RepID=UPI000B41E342|nr:hypothetical protein [Comamonas thiooxydans]
MVYLYHLLTVASVALTLFLGYRAVTTRTAGAAVGAVICAVVVVTAAMLMLSADRQRKHESARLALVVSYGELHGVEFGPTVPPKAAVRIKTALVTWAGTRDANCSETSSVLAQALLNERLPNAVPAVLTSDASQVLGQLCQAMVTYKNTAPSAATKYANAMLKR